VTAQEALGLALAALADRGERTPCQRRGVRDRWTSDSREDREYAAASCSGCPVYTRCAAAAGVAREPWGVWAGVDRTPPRSKGKGASWRHRSADRLTSRYRLRDTSSTHWKQRGPAGDPLQGMSLCTT